jgi:hypothetical protein
LNHAIEELETSQLAPGEPSTYIPLLKRIAVELSSNGRYVSSKSEQSVEPSDTFTVTDSWCLYSRPKPSAVWARDANKFAEMLTHPDFVLPKATWALTHGPGHMEQFEKAYERELQGDGGSGAMSLIKSAVFGSSGSSKSAAFRPLFPLPTSDSQNRIADLLLAKNYPTVVCEGPPGTGKTHTIANIICAYLCQGKRVLVTSKGAPALSVLRERLPSSVRDLVVDVSMSESVGMRQLQKTVERLANKVSWVNAAREEGRCETLKVRVEIYIFTEYLLYTWVVIWVSLTILLMHILS